MKTPGEILKEIRNEYGISQKECSSNDIDRSLISHLESGKFTMSEEVAKKIANNINIAFVKRKIMKKIDPLIFFEEKYRVLLKASERVNHLNEYMLRNNIREFDTEMTMLEEIMEEYYLPEIKLRMLELAAMMAKKQKDYMKGYIYGVRALDIAVFLRDEETQIRLYRYITHFLFNLEKYEDVEKVVKRVLEKYKNLTDLNLFLYNCGISMKYLGQYQDAIEYLNAINLAPELVNKSQLADIKLTLAMCFLNVGKNQTSLQILEEIKDMYDGRYSYHVANSYILMINNYVMLNEVDKVRELVVKAEAYMDPEDDQFVYSQLYMEIGEVQEFLHNYKSAALSYLQSIKNAVRQKRYKLIGPVVQKLQLLMERGLIRRSEEHIFSMLPLIISSELNDTNMMIFLSMMDAITEDELLKGLVSELLKIIKDRS